MHEVMRHPLKSGVMRDHCLFPTQNLPVPAAGAAARASITKTTTTKG
ncbi:MAG: hypothetical protein K8F51_10930 [Comamonas sp.]|nr:hypothetical protein [Comamonas sp.]